MNIWIQFESYEAFKQNCNDKNALVRPLYNIETTVKILSKELIFSTLDNKEFQEWVGCGELSEFAIIAPRSLKLNGEVSLGDKIVVGNIEYIVECFYNVWLIPMSSAIDEEYIGDKLLPAKAVSEKPLSKAQKQEVEGKGIHFTKENVSIDYSYPITICGIVMLLFVYIIIVTRGIAKGTRNNYSVLQAIGVKKSKLIACQLLVFSGFFVLGSSLGFLLNRLMLSLYTIKPEMLNVLLLPDYLIVFSFLIVLFFVSVTSTLSLSYKKVALGLKEAQ